MTNQRLPSKCPHCGFSVLTNRYPKCEKCDRLLPADMVLSKEELDAVFAKEQQDRESAAQAANEKQRHKPKIGTGDPGPNADIDWLGFDV